ncbi:hypothetical protein PUN28_007704 [Cardiocondyla obscurior]|uniref:Uncharacterized protein n=1 Tax=Cardiocondyla obscurior TaxID=286306 RepID=A0AAW2FVY0_9HYME
MIDTRFIVGYSADRRIRNQMRRFRAISSLTRQLLWPDTFVLIIISAKIRRRLLSKMNNTSGKSRKHLVTRVLESGAPFTGRRAQKSLLFVSDPGVNPGYATRLRIWRAKKRKKKKGEIHMRSLTHLSLGR